MVYIRSTLFVIYMWISIPVFTLIFLLAFPIPYKYRSQLISLWARSTLFALKLSCGLKYIIEGKENIPEKPCIVFSKHQSTWETLALQLMFTPQVWILKRELLWIPFFGWTLASMKSIAIDRSSGKKALKQIVQQGSQRLQEGNWVIIFPEGTRTKPGQKESYKIGGPMLAKNSGFDVLPVAHNAGEFWPKGQFLKHPGTIKMVIGPVIQVTGLSTKQISQQAEQWIETTVYQLYEKQYEQ
jgi:1-acyl-sn-glycerol-3-phosphate acyltransferase